MSRKVMIQGHVFDYELKAPFIPSGVSVFGAVEYDFQKDKLRCHECGEWFASLAHHIAHGVHDISLREYKTKHGLRIMASLVSRSGAASRSKHSTERNSGNIVSLRDRPEFSNRKQAAKRNLGEERNMDGRCAAQLSLKIKNLSREVKRTPTTAELKQRGISTSVLLRSFKVETLSEVMALIGLEPRQPGHRLAMEIEWL